MRDLMRRLSGNDPSTAKGPLNPSSGGGAPIRPEDTPDALTAELKYRDAQRLAADGQWGPALNVLNKVLVLQRKALGQDHVNSGRTLNDIGVALMNLGRYFPAQTALKEAQYIRENALGCGAPEVAETLTNLAILMDKVNEAEDEAHVREEKREVVRRKSLGSLDAAISPDVAAGLAKRCGSSNPDFGLRDFDDDSDSDSDISDHDGKQLIMDELQRLEERREQMRLMSMQMAADRKRLSMEHMAQQNVRRKSGGGLSAGLAAIKNMGQDALESEVMSGATAARRRKSGGSLSLGLNAMDAAKASASSHWKDQTEGNRSRSGSLGALSADAAITMGDVSSDEEDFDLPKPRRRSGGFLGGGGAGGAEKEPRGMPRPRSFDHLSMGAAIQGQMDLRKQIRDEHKPKRRMSGGLLSSAMSKFGDANEDWSYNDEPAQGFKSFSHIAMSKEPSVDLKDQIRREHQRPKRRFSNGLLKTFNQVESDDSEDDGKVDHVNEIMRERMVFGNA